MRFDGARFLGGGLRSDGWVAGNYGIVVCMLLVSCG